MKRYRICAALALVWNVAMTGCNPDDYAERGIDICVKREVFAECMASLPEGPERTHYNDWSEVVEVCDERSHRMALRLARDIPRGCR
jgi:hypothetical protein